MKTYNVCLVKTFSKFFVLFIFFQYFLYMNNAYAQSYQSDNQFSLFCRVIVTSNSANKGQIIEEIYNFTLTPPSVYLTNYKISFPVLYSQNQIEIIGGNNAIISRITGSYIGIGMNGQCQKVTDKKLF